jgi:hypothetical protein
MIPIKSINLNKILNDHSDYIMLYYNKRNRLGKLDSINNWVEDVFGRNYTFEDILKATPEKISHFVKKHDLVKAHPPDEILNLRNLYFRFAVVSKSPFPNYNAFELIDKLGITVCPYCNRNYIINVRGR